MKNYFFKCVVKFNLQFGFHQVVVNINYTTVDFFITALRQPLKLPLVLINSWFLKCPYSKRVFCCPHLTSTGN